LKANTYIREVEVKFKTKPKPEEIIRIGSPTEAVKFFMDLQDETQEKIIALHLDIRNTISCFQIVSIGSSTSAIVDPKTILRTSLLTNSHALILIHNLPSGDPTPSQDDITTKIALQNACKFLDIQLLDFIIIGDYSAFYSFSEAGILNEK